MGAWHDTKMCSMRTVSCDVEIVLIALALARKIGVNDTDLGESTKLQVTIELSSRWEFSMIEKSRCIIRTVAI